MVTVDYSLGPTYCTVEDVQETLGLPSPDDPQGIFEFSEVSNPTYSRVEKMIMMAEDEIDMRTGRSWRVNYVKDQIRTIADYMMDSNGYRIEYHRQGGNFVQLHKDILPWDPEQGDKLELRTHANSWSDITCSISEEGGTLKNWFDYKKGKLYIRQRRYLPQANAVRISYRYGSEEPVPLGINRLCSLLVASRIIVMGVFDIKVGTGGDISGLKNQLLTQWDKEIGILYSSYQRSGSVHSMLR